MQSKDPKRIDAIRSFVQTFEKQNGRTPTVREIAGGTGISRSAAQRYLVAMDGDRDFSYHDGCIETPLTRRTQMRSTMVGVIGEIACGLPRYADEVAEEYLPLPVSLTGEGEFFLLRAVGESMIEAGISDGDLVLIRKQNTARTGQIVVALTEDEATLKRYFPEPGKRRIRLHPENSSMKDLYVPDCLIQGVAVKVIKELR